MDNVAAASIGPSGVVTIKTDGSLWLLAKEHKKIADGNVIYAVTMGEEIGYITSDHAFWAWNPEEGNAHIMDNVRAVGGGYYTVKPDGTVHSWRYDSNIMNQYTRGFSDIRLTDIATPMSKPAAGAGPV